MKEGSLFIKHVQEVILNAEILSNIFSKLSDEFKKRSREYEFKISAKYEKLAKEFSGETKAISRILKNKRAEIFSAMNRGGNFVLYFYRYEREKEESAPDFSKRTKELIEKASDVLDMIGKGLMGVSSLSVQYRAFSRPLNRKKLSIKDLEKYLRKL